MFCTETRSLGVHRQVNKAGQKDRAGADVNNKGAG